MSSSSFLDQLVSDLIARFGPDPEHLVVVLPGKRARLFLYRAWADQAGRPVWAPKVLTMEEFVAEATGLETIDEISLTLALWEVCKLTPDFDVNFEQFTGWAPIILRDFNDVDLFLADARQVFGNLLDAKELTLWTPGEVSQLSDYEEMYLSFYRRLLPWYESFRMLLKSRNQAYQGMAFRTLAEDKELLLRHWSHNQIVFAGFNAFTPSEELMIKGLQQAGIARMRWDADTWYLNDRLQEAGTFIRNWNARNPEKEFMWRNAHLSSDPKQITVYGVHGNRAQARLAGSLLPEVDEASTDTAIVLPDESLLLPVLNSVPQHIGKFNVTMGMPYRHTPALSWLRLNLQLFTRAGRKPSSWIRMLNLLPVVRHPWFRWLLAENQGAKGGDPVGMLKKRFYHAEELITIFTEAYPDSAEILMEFFTPVLSPDMFIRKMELTVRRLLDDPGITARPFEQGALLETLRLLKQVEQVVPVGLDHADGVMLLRFTLNRLLQSASIPFTGEPLEGIQILGLLETRNLDFKHVILLSANERILPSGRKQPSLIPADIRYAHALPGVQHQDAIYAFHFYHLLQRADRIDILYNTDLSSEFSGEMSRFIRQIENELIPANPKIIYHHHKIADEIIRSNQHEPISIQKSDAVIALLVDRLTSRGLSPTQISNYVRCPLKFYFSFLAGITEAESLEETVDHRELGTLVHETLQQLYQHNTPENESSINPAGIQPFLLNDHFFAAALSRSDATVMQVLQTLLGGVDTISGKNLIIAEVAQFMVKQFLENERKQLENHRIEILDLERLLAVTLEVPYENGLLSVKLKGFADRIDRFDGVIRITDYKTGKVNVADLKFPSVEEVFMYPKHEKALQLLFYCWSYAKATGESHVNAGIFPLKHPSAFYLGLPAMEGASTESINNMLDSFEAELLKVCDNLLNRALPFNQTDDPDICKQCAFHPICLTPLE